MLAAHTSNPFSLEAEYWLTPLTDLHFYAERNVLGPGGDIRYVYIFLSVALLILLVASVNYMNLATARSAGRAREVGVRKVAGANRWQLARQFLGESILLSLTALLLALALTWLVLPLFNATVQAGLSASTLLKAPFLPALFGAALFIGVLSGVYPALVLSRFEPTEVLKGRGLTVHGHSLFRRALVVFQFVVSVALIAGTLVIQRQLDYFRTTQLGLDKEHVLVVPAKSSPIAEGRAEVFKRELLGKPGIASVAVSSSVPTRGGVVYGVRAEGIEGDVEVAFREVDRDFLETFGVELKAGQSFSGTGPSVLLNEAAIRRLGWEDPVGKRIFIGRAWHPVAGVVRDFHFESLREEIRPLILAPQDQPSVSYVSVKVQSGDLRATIDRIGATWGQLAPGYPFTTFSSTMPLTSFTSRVTGWPASSASSRCLRSS